MQHQLPTAIASLAQSDDVIQLEPQRLLLAVLLQKNLTQQQRILETTMRRDCVSDVTTSYIADRPAHALATGVDVKAQFVNIRQILLDQNLVLLRLVLVEAQFVRRRQRDDVTAPLLSVQNDVRLTGRLAAVFVIADVTIVRLAGRVSTAAIVAFALRTSVSNRDVPLGSGRLGSGGRLLLCRKQLALELAIVLALVQPPATIEV